jgi:histidyl-tRNA synthetase
MIAPRTPPGTLELLPREQLAFERMLGTIRTGFERFGFLPIETPAFELTDVLLTKTGGETERQVYFVQSTGAREAGKEPELALRFDLTVPLARYVAQYENQLAFPFRRYQIQRVYRGERNQRGRFREFYQCDIDVVGKDSLPIAYDAEMPAVINQVFRALDFGPFTIRINNRKLLNGLLRSVGVVEPERRAAVLREVDKLDKAGREAVEASLAAVIGSEAGRLLDLVSGVKMPDIADELFQQGRAELDTVVSTMQAQGVPVKVDLSIARGLDYYTGTIYETVLDQYPGIGSVCSGGRYDDLAGLYTRSKLPGVGLSIGATRLFFQLKEAGLIKAEDSTCTVFIAQIDPQLTPDARALAAELRAAGVNTELAPEAGKAGKQFKYADRAGIRYVALIGGDEKAKGVVTVKDLRQNAERQLPRAQVVAELASAR